MASIPKMQEQFPVISGPIFNSKENHSGIAPAFLYCNTSMYLSYSQK
jgi:hypothetical protein